MRSPLEVSRVASGLLCLHAIAITPAGPTELVRSSISIVSGLPCVTVRSAPAIIVSGPAQRSLTLWPVRSPSRLATLYTRKLRQLRCLRRRFDCYRVERTSSRAGVAPAEAERLSRRTISTVDPLESPNRRRSRPTGLNSVFQSPSYSCPEVLGNLTIQGGV